MAEITRAEKLTQEGQETPSDDTATTTVKIAFRLISDKAYSLIALNVEIDMQIFGRLGETKQQFEFISITQIVRLSRKLYAASMDENGDLVKHIT